MKGPKNKVKETAHIIMANVLRPEEGLNLFSLAKKINNVYYRQSDTLPAMKKECKYSYGR